MPLPTGPRRHPVSGLRLLRRAFDLVRERQDEVALLMTLEMGKPLAESKAEVIYGGEFLRWFSEEAVRIFGRYGVNPEGTGRMIVSQHPVGPCLLDHSVELPAGDGDPQDRAGTGCRLHRGDQAARADSVDHACTSSRSWRRPACRPASSM